ncbi:hypothetical protein Pyn_09025 [Prunus yedoensis var. nudiflora]|uniref:Uncharacterized protein n=1 Tax=Prunus yedoensis var. nudiflora TaxID=2094558 RepID=A0A314YHA3_PRUYE|nr:hypothetical protein Pyn_09025 [Prunus yedoensis var. nudiflora]
MWESCKIEKKEFSPERNKSRNPLKRKWTQRLGVVRRCWIKLMELLQPKSIDDGRISPSKQQQTQNKKPLLRKFGSVFKKKSTSNQK